MIKHSIIMITYNQENLVGIAIDSVLNQDTRPYEILISDDCSTDNTFNILAEYQKKHPTIIKIYRQEKNLGIFGNLNSVYSKASGDIVSVLAGDDYYKPGLFTSLNKIIDSNNLNPQDEAFIIVYNTIHLHKNGKESLFNNFQIRKNNPFKERIRYGISYREVGVSINLWNKIDPIIEDLGYMADWIYGFDQIEKCEKFFFINEAYSVYRLNTGVTKTVLQKQDKNKYINNIKVLSLLSEKYKNKFDFRDKLYFTMVTAEMERHIKESIFTYFKYITFYIINLTLINGSKNNPLIKKWKSLLPYKIHYRLFILRNKIRNKRN